MQVNGTGNDRLTSAGTSTAEQAGVDAGGGSNRSYDDDVFGPEPAGWLLDLVDDVLDDVDEADELLWWLTEAPWGTGE